jgi:hypothetical protein
MRSRRATPQFVRAAAAVVGALVLAPSAAAQADPQATVGLTVGAAGAGLNRSIWQGTAFHLGIHGDVLFGRERNSDFGIGPYAEVLTNGFDEIQFGGGVSGLLPILNTFPLVLSLGGYGRAAGGYGRGPIIFGGATGVIELEPGLAAELFFGSRSYNFHAPYVMTAGLIGQMRYGLGPTRETSIVVGAQVDFAILSLPFVFLINAIRGGSPETDPVR